MARQMQSTSTSSSTSPTGGVIGSPCGHNAVWVSCQRCHNGNPVGNMFCGSCQQGWTPADGTNPCTQTSNDGCERVTPDWCKHYQNAIAGGLQQNVANQFASFLGITVIQADALLKRCCTTGHGGDRYSCEGNQYCYQDANGIYSSLVHCQQNCPPQSKDFDCIDSNCMAVAPNTGQYATMLACQQAGCGRQDRYTCEGNQYCAPHPTGIYTSLAQCQQQCPQHSKDFDCIDSNCMAVQPNTGQYATMQACIDAGCEGDRYSCEQGQHCYPDSNGIYASLSDCQANCTRWTCESAGNCQPNPNGQYATLQDCLKACPDVSTIPCELTSEACADIQNFYAGTSQYTGASGLQQLLQHWVGIFASPSYNNGAGYIVTTTELWAILVECCRGGQGWSLPCEHFQDNGCCAKCDNADGDPTTNNMGGLPLMAPNHQCYGWCQQNQECCPSPSTPPTQGIISQRRAMPRGRSRTIGYSNFTSSVFKQPIVPALVMGMVIGVGLFASYQLTKSLKV